MYHISCIMYHISYVTCHISYNIYHVSHICVPCTLMPECECFPLHGLSHLKSHHGGVATVLCKPVNHRSRGQTTSKCTDGCPEEASAPLILKCDGDQRFTKDFSATRTRQGQGWEVKWTAHTLPSVREEISLQMQT